MEEHHVSGLRASVCAGPLVPFHSHANTAHRPAPPRRSPHFDTCVSPGLADDQYMTYDDQYDDRVVGLMTSEKVL